MAGNRFGMIKLSDRLQRIADRIETGETMADIGCDHGFLPIYLKLTDKSPRVIIADVSGPSLEKAVCNARLYGLGTEDGGFQGDVCRDMDFRIGDGLSVLTPGEVDSIVIAGMGGKLIRDILAADLERTRSFKRFVLQPRIGQGHLRKWLIESGFVITSEDLVVEGAHISEIITVLNPCRIGENPSCELMIDATVKTAGYMQGQRDKAETSGDAMIWKVPPWIIHAQGPVMDFLTRNINAEEKKLENVMQARVRDEQLEKKICNEIDYLKGLVKEYQYGQQEKCEK